MLKYLICLLAISSALGDVTFPATPTVKSSFTGYTVTQYTNGIVVSLSAAGFIVSDNVVTASSTANAVANTFYTTITAAATGATSNSAVGLVATGGGSCTTAVLTGYSTIVAQAAGNCPGDFLTLYSTAPAASNTVPALSATTSDIGVSAIAVGTKSVGWEIKVPATNQGLCDQVTVSPPGASAGLVDTGNNKVANTNGYCQGTGTTANAAAGAIDTTAPGDNTAGGNMIKSLSYGLYIEQIGAGATTVCIQNGGQWTLAAGICGTIMPLSANLKDVTWTNPTISSATAAKVAQYTQGYQVTFTGPSYVVSDAMASLYSTEKTGYIVYATLTNLAASTTVSVGPAVVVSTGTNTPPCNTAALLTADRPAATAAALVGGAAKTCASDFLSVYSPANYASSTSKLKAVSWDTTAKTLKYLFISPETAKLKQNTGKCVAVDFWAPAATIAATAVPTNDFNPTGECAATPTTNQQGYMITGNTYALGVELEAGTAATVCIQTAAQYTASAGNCGTASASGSSSSSSSSSTTSSATLLSSMIGSFMLILFALLN